MEKKQLKKIILLSMLSLCLNKKEVNAKELYEYVSDQVKYYKEHPDNLEYDLLEKDKLFLKRGFKSNEPINYSVSTLEPKLGDFVYVWGCGNETSDGIGKETVDVTPTSYEYDAKVIVGIKSDSSYPYALADYDIEEDKLGEVIGWFKKDNISVRVLNYADVIEAPIVKNITFNDLADNSYRKINGNYSIKLSYSKKDMPEGYYLSKDGYYVDESSITSKRQTLDEENIKKLSKYKIKNK